MSAEAASNLSKEIQVLEFKIKNRVENNAENLKYGQDSKLDAMQSDLSKLMGEMSTMLPALSDSERRDVLGHMTELDCTQLLNEQGCKAVALSKKIRKLEKQVKAQTCDLVLSRSNSSVEADGMLSSSSSDDEAQGEQEAIQAKLDKMMLELSSLLPMLDETSKHVVFENIQAVYE
jgi:hypothetical protein